MLPELAAFHDEPCASNGAVKIQRPTGRAKKDFFGEALARPDVDSLQSETQFP